MCETHVITCDHVSFICFTYFTCDFNITFVINFYLLFLWEMVHFWSFYSCPLKHTAWVTHIITCASSLNSSSDMKPSRTVLTATCILFQLPFQTKPNCPLPSSSLNVNSSGWISHLSVKEMDFVTPNKEVVTFHLLHISVLGKVTFKSNALQYCVSP